MPFRIGVLKNNVGSCFHELQPLIFRYVRLFPVVLHAQGPNLQEVVIKIKGCVDCGVEAVTGDDWREHGYFLFGNKLAVHLTHMDRVRQEVQGGTAISHAFTNLLKPLTNNLRWLSENKLASRWVAWPGEGKIAIFYLAGGHGDSGVWGMSTNHHTRWNIKGSVKFA